MSEFRNIEELAHELTYHRYLLNQSQARGLIRETRVGASRWMVLPVRDVTELYRQALLTEGSALYGL